MPPDSSRAWSSRLSHRSSCREALGAPVGLAARNAVVTRLVDDDLDHRLPLVEIELLGYQADARLHPRRVRIQVVTEYVDRPGRLVDQRADDADRGRLSRTVRPEQGEKVPFIDVKVDTAQGLVAVAIGLVQRFDRQCLHRAFQIRTHTAF